MIICDYSFDLTAHLVFMILKFKHVFCPVLYFGVLLCCICFSLYSSNSICLLYCSCFVCFWHYFLLMFKFCFDLYVLICYVSLFFSNTWWFLNFNVSLLSIRHRRDSLCQLVCRIWTTSISPTWILELSGSFRKTSCALHRTGIHTFTINHQPCIM